jgi:hypothetical protein
MGLFLAKCNYNALRGILVLSTPFYIAKSLQSFLWVPTFSLKSSFLLYIPFLYPPQYFSWTVRNIHCLDSVLLLFVRLYASALNVICLKTTEYGQYNTWQNHEAMCKPIRETVHSFSQFQHAPVVTGTPACPHRSMQPLTLHLFYRQPAQKQNEQSSALLRYCFVLIRTQTFDRNEVKT